MITSEMKNVLELLIVLIELNLLGNKLSHMYFPFLWKKDILNYDSAFLLE